MASAAVATLPSVFGLQLGAPIALPECVRMVATVTEPGVRPPYRPDQNRTCQRLPREYGPTSANDGAIVFAPGARPEIVGSNAVGVTVIDGRLEGISAITLSYNVAAEIVRQLTSKFGPPSGTGSETVEVEHIPVRGAWTRWDRPGFTVEYHTTDVTIDHGLLLVETGKARALREAKEKAADAARTPL